MKKSLLYRITILFLVLSCIGCATVKIKIPPTFELAKDYKSRHIKTVAVLPPMLCLSTQALVRFEKIGGLPSDEETCKIFYPTISSIVQQRKYTLLAPQTMAELLEKNALHNTQQIYALNKEKIAQIFNVDVVLYSYIIDVSSVKNIIVFAKLVDTKEGTILWSGLGNASEYGGVSGAIAGGVGGAIAAGGGILLGPFAMVGALAGDRVAKILYLKLASLEGKVKATVRGCFKSLPSCLDKGP